MFTPASAVSEPHMLMCHACGEQAEVPTFSHAWTWGRHHAQSVHRGEDAFVEVWEVGT